MFLLRHLYSPSTQPLNHSLVHWPVISGAPVGALGMPVLGHDFRDISDSRPPMYPPAAATDASAPDSHGDRSRLICPTTHIRRHPNMPSKAKLLSLTPSATQIASSTLKATSGTVVTGVATTASQPFATSVNTATSKISLINTSSTKLPTAQTMATSKPTISAPNLFLPMDTAAPPSQIGQRSDHPVARLGIKSQTQKLETNKFYANFFLGNQNQPSFTYPYSVSWSKGSGAASSWGLAVSHIEASQLVYPSGSPPEYFINPGGIQSVILSATELNNSKTTLTTDTLTGFSVNVNLNKVSGSTTTPVVTFPLVQGMAYVTGVYTNGTPLLQSSVSFLTLTYVGKITGTIIQKYRATLGDKTTWLIYLRPTSTYAGNTLTIQNGYNILGAAGFSGWLQVAKVPTSTSTSTDYETIYDASAGVYATTANITGSASGTTGTYTISWTKAGVTGRPLLMFALPHHIATLTNGQKTDVKLRTTTKGMGTAVVADSWTLSENLPTDIGFAPWSPSTGSVTKVSAAAQQLIVQAATSELSQNMPSQTNLNSMYYSGKGLAKFAAICYAANDIGGNKTLAYTGLKNLESAFATFVNNKQIYPLVYESAWGGVVSSASYSTGNSGDDFGNTYYNDHHFHYGYFVYAAAVIGYLDPTWLTAQNVAWVNTLIRDYANPSASDSYFPFSRMYDWYHGHSWAAGLFEAADGKNQESSSEDSNAAWALKLWGAVTNNTALEGRGALMMAVQARSLQNYYLYTTDNTNEPSVFIPNKVAGILFDNKIDHTTYFGSNKEYIEGIHMIPVMPFSAWTRTTTFVTQEWNTYFANGAVDSVAGGWRGILYANYAIINPTAAWNFFKNTSFDMNLLDGGASLTWYRTYSAALGGSSA
ncbi:glycoside hydrolase family 81 protein [Myriangium duriaei CBS 260.36]|uniref:glucan endo-1,3-beta-D-glucosidase n=1 Tax=Myriangium duriaei CBS 260.36 TaxID=1168546 RepID=A0A9P4MNQ4_9PEZI|nr:glycoside hydrolase family 81 protein [Myriangium duriaei CBS 260.36]